MPPTDPVKDEGKRQTMANKKHPKGKIAGEQIEIAIIVPQQRI